MKRSRPRYDREVRHKVGYCAAPDAVKLAYAVHGGGPPIVRVATWMTHLEFDWESPVWRHWLDALGDGHTLIRYDERGCGLSDRDVDDISFDAWVADLEAVVDAAGVDRFALLGVSAGAAVAVAYAARHPERLTHLVLYGGYARGRTLRGAGQRRLQEALVAAISAGWTNPDPTFRHLFSMLFLPAGTPEQMGWYDDLQRHSTSAATAVRLYDARGRLNVVDLAARVRTRTLVVHAAGDRVVPVDEGRLLATLLPEAQLVLLESANHILLSDEPAWANFVAELRAFLGTEPAVAQPGTGIEELSPRELDVLALVAAGLTNEVIADRLSLSVRTVERHLTNTYVKLRVSGKAGRAAAAARFSEAQRP
ncbi:alpha/beta fold hydrolase [Kribbella pittospori]|uniref:Alpha/beta fold hydrolase n=1 Tax=Kribbella pittospori TaxID=722689 RepID=A0A4R0KRC2_9ACTN|nr:alpha/beta fold hydrolase [Kribbella pittospori]